MSIVSKKNPVAKKDYECMLCGCPIHAGEKYCRITSRTSTSFYDYIRHINCEDAIVQNRNNITSSVRTTSRHLKWMRKTVNPNVQ